MDSKNERKRIICQNRKATHEYEILDSIEAGIVLLGSEIKSINNRNISLDGAYAMIINHEVFLLGCNIDSYKYATQYKPESRRQRKLLMHRSEIDKFAKLVKVKGHTLIPLSVYLVNGKAKVNLALCKGKQIHDKRTDARLKDAKKEIKKYNG